MARKPKPAKTLVTFAYSVVDESGTGAVTFLLPWNETVPGVVDGLKACGSIVDVRATNIGVRENIPLAYPRERRWLITLLALAEGDAVYEAMREAQETLREDVYAGRLRIGAHPGRPAVTDGPQAPLEAALAAFREETVAELERAEQKRQADRLKRAYGRRRWWRRSAW